MFDNHPLNDEELTQTFAEFREKADELLGDVEHLIDNFQLKPESFAHAKHIALVLNRAMELLQTTSNVGGKA